MIEEKIAIEKVISTTPDPIMCNMPVEEAHCSFLLKDVKAMRSSPIVNQSAMDGYGIRVRDKKFSNLEIIGESLAGNPYKTEVNEGESVRVLTGANIPKGVDAVVMQEDCDVIDGKLFVNDLPKEGQFIRKIGEVFSEGQTIARKGKKINSPTIAAIISAGVFEVSISQKIRVGIITTGDEVKSIANDELKDFEIYNSNQYMIKSAVNELGIENVSFAHVVDDEAKTRDVIKKMLNKHDILIVSGGISVGKKDLIRGSLQNCGVKEEFWRVKIKPGKPIFYGTYNNGCQVFGLPGNPVSSYVGFLIFVLPALRIRMGIPKDQIGLETVKFELIKDIINKGDRVNYMMGEINEMKELHLHGKQTSNNILGLSNSNVLIRVDPNSTLSKGEAVQGYLIK